MREVNLIVPAEVGAPCERALGLFTAGLKALGIDVLRAAPGESPRATGPTLVLSFGETGPAEAFDIRRTEGASFPRVTVRGADDAGLMYGVFDLLGQIEAGGRVEAVRDVSRTPDLAVRSVSLFPMNRVLEEEWFHDPAHWDAFFGLLARSRFNHFALTFGHNTAWFAPPFPFLFEVPGYGRVRVPSLSGDERARNLDTLKRISALAREWGIRLVLGVWSQHAYRYGENLVEGLQYDDLFDYCPKGLGILLDECPHIAGVQFRMNSESGIEERDQRRFFSGMLRAVRDSGRALWIDLRAKGLREETICAAVDDLGLDVTVSTKFWCEHMGLPHFATRVNPRDVALEAAYRRYGFWDLLPRKRPYRMLYRLWSHGSQKLLLWGDPEYARRFARSCRLGDALGFEVASPLSNKGCRNLGRPWRIFADADREYFRWEFERYWAFYMTFGLAGYDREGDQPIYEAEFVKRFGKEAAPAMRDAYGAAGRYLPLATASHQPSASCFSYWPEMDTGGLTDTFIRVTPGDIGRFRSVLASVEDDLAGRVSGKMKPREVARLLDGIAERIERALDRAGPLVEDAEENREFASTRIDFLATAALARYRAARILSGEQYALFLKSGARAFLLGAISDARAALEHWKRVVRLTDGVYHDHMVFSIPPRQIGHWKDDLPFLEHDVERLREIDALYMAYCRRPSEASGLDVEHPWYVIQVAWKEEDGVFSRSVGDILPAMPPPDIAYETHAERNRLQAPAAVIKGLLGGRREPVIAHAPLRAAQAGREILIHASLIGGESPAAMRLLFRTDRAGGDFRPVEMRASRENVYSCAIPPQAHGEKILYYIESRAADGVVTHGSSESPHRMLVADMGERPRIEHDPVAVCRPGEGLRIQASVRASLPLAFVRLHYRRLNQVEPWTVVDMAPVGDSTHETVIPGDFITGEWDIMYALEVADEAGRAAFHPDMMERAPYEVVVVRTE